VVGPQRMRFSIDRAQPQIRIADGSVRHTDDGRR